MLSFVVVFVEDYFIVGVTFVVVVDADSLGVPAKIRNWVASINNSKFWGVPYFKGNHNHKHLFTCEYTAVKLFNHLLETEIS